MLKISPKAIISKLADIEESVRGSNIIIEDDVKIDSFVKIKPAGGKGDLVIGKGTCINSGVVIYTGNGLQIGENVLIAANCTLAPVNHEYNSAEKKICEQYFMTSRGGIIIENDVWVGANTVLLDGAILREGCVIGAHSLVRNEVAPHTVVAGNPLREIGRRR